MYPDGRPALAELRSRGAVAQLTPHRQGAVRVPRTSSSFCAVVVGAGPPVGIYTNATQTTDEQIAYLAERGQVHVKVSFGGFRPVSHGKLRGDRSSFGGKVTRLAARPGRRSRTWTPVSESAVRDAGSPRRRSGSPTLGDPRRTGRWPRSACPRRRRTPTVRGCAVGRSAARWPSTVPVRQLVAGRGCTGRLRHVTRGSGRFVDGGRRRESRGAAHRRRRCGHR